MIFIDIDFAISKTDTIFFNFDIAYVFQILPMFSISTMPDRDHRTNCIEVKVIFCLSTIFYCLPLLNWTLCQSTSLPELAYVTNILQIEKLNEGTRIKQLLKWAHRALTYNYVLGTPSYSLSTMPNFA